MHSVTMTLFASALMLLGAIPLQTNNTFEAAEAPSEIPLEVRTYVDEWLNGLPDQDRRTLEDDGLWAQLEEVFAQDSRMSGEPSTCTTPVTIPVGNALEDCAFDCFGGGTVSAGGSGMFGNSAGVVFAFCQGGLVAACTVPGGGPLCAVGVVVLVDAPGVCVAIGLAISGTCESCCPPDEAAALEPRHSAWTRVDSISAAFGNSVIRSAT